MYAFNLDVPAGVNSIQASLDFLISAPGPTIDFAASGSAKLFILMWNQVILYPKGWPATQLTFQPSLTVPAGWKFNTSLPIASQSADTVTFSPVPLDLLVRFACAVGRIYSRLPVESWRKTARTRSMWHPMIPGRSIFRRP